MADLSRLAATYGGLIGPCRSCGSVALAFDTQLGRVRVVIQRADYDRLIDDISAAGIEGRAVCQPCVGGK